MRSKSHFPFGPDSCLAPGTFPAAASRVQYREVQPYSRATQFRRFKLTFCITTSEKITTTLKNSRTQLPPDGPGVFFIKIPQKWTECPDWEKQTAQGALDFFSMGIQRVASVVFYVEPLHYKDGRLAQGHLFLEVINPRHKLASRFDWRLFERWKPMPSSPHGMPPFWLRLSNFPSGFHRYMEAMQIKE